MNNMSSVSQFKTFFTDPILELNENNVYHLALTHYYETFVIKSPTSQIGKMSKIMI